MFNRKPVTDESLEAAIDRILTHMETAPPDSDEYESYTQQLEKLHKLRPQQPEGVSPNQVLTVAGNIVGILLIVTYEQKHVVATKALDIVNKFR